MHAALLSKRQKYEHRSYSKIFYYAAFEMLRQIRLWKSVFFFSGESITWHKFNSSQMTRMQLGTSHRSLVSEFLIIDVIQIDNCESKESQTSVLLSVISSYLYGTNEREINAEGILEALQRGIADLLFLAGSSRPGRRLTYIHISMYMLSRTE